LSGEFFDALRVNSYDVDARAFKSGKDSVTGFVKSAESCS